MTLLWMDGFDLYSATPETELDRHYTTGASQHSISFVGNRLTSGAYLIQDDNNDILSKNLSVTSSNSYIVCCAARFDTSGLNTIPWLELRNNAGANVALEVDINGTISGFSIRDANNSIIHTIADVVDVGLTTWHFIEVKATISGSSNDSLVIRVDNTEVVNLSSRDFTDGDLFIDQVRFQGTSNRETNLDDLIIMDGNDDGTILNDFLGDVGIQTLSASSDSTPEQWGLTTGSDTFEMINDAVPGKADDDTTVISSSTVGQESWVTHSPTSGTIDVLAVGTITTHKKSDAGARTFRARIRESSAEITGSQISPATTFGETRDFFPVNPSTSASWTQAEVDVVETGVEVVS